MKAEQFLRQGADVLAERGKEYDKPEGERSMARTVAAFQAITGKSLTEAEGWLFMQVLKDVRQWQNPDRYHEDSAVDGVNYSALKAEALSDAECSSPKIDGKPSWDDAPVWARWLVCDGFKWYFCSERPALMANSKLDFGGMFFIGVGLGNHRHSERRPTKES